MMSIREFKQSLIPKIKAFVSVPIIEADQIGPKPDGPHVTFKITTPYLKDRGRDDEYTIIEENQLTMGRINTFKRIISFTAYDMDNDASFDLAQQIYDWFDFYGSDALSAQNMVVSDITAVQNRDVFFFDDYERRNGFDVTMRLSRANEQQFDYIESVGAFSNDEVIEDQPIDIGYSFDNDGVIDKEYMPGVDVGSNYVPTMQPMILAGSALGQQTIL